MHKSSTARTLNWRMPTAITCGALVCTLGVGSALAYLTDSANLNNPFTLDTNLSIELSEPSFDENDAKDLAPTQTVAKDPRIKNDGSLGAYVAATVKVPVFSGEQIDSEGKLVSGENMDLFSYSLNDGWSQLGEATLSDGFRTYTYVYNTLLDPDKTTNPIFDSVTLANLIKDIGVSATSIDVDAFAIQSEGFSDAVAACNAYAAQNAAIATATN